MITKTSRAFVVLVSLAICIALLMTRWLFADERRPSVPGPLSSLTLEYGQSPRTIALTLFRRSVTLERNDLPYSYSGPSPDTEVEPLLRTVRNARPHFFFCGTGKDRLETDIDWRAAGVRWTSGTWIKNGTRTRDRPFFALAVPNWMVIVVTAVVPLRIVAAWFWRWRQFAHGCCPTCGYDLRATPDRCPECGTRVSSVSAPPIGYHPAA